MLSMRSVGREAAEKWAGISPAARGGQSGNLPAW
jgi:hypothetical protein